METSLTYDIAGGSLAVWIDETGAIRLKVRESGSAVELAEHEALGLASFLMRLTLQPAPGT